MVVDKPFALTAAAAQELVDHAERAGLVITPYQNRRWDSDFLTVRRLITDGSLGTVHRFTSRIDRFKPVKGSWHGGTVEQGGGTLLDLGPHLVDQALHLFGPAELVHAELADRARRAPAPRTTSSCTCDTPAGSAPPWPRAWRPRRRGRGSRSTEPRPAT